MFVYMKVILYFYFRLIKESKTLKKITMLTLITLPVFKGTRNETLKALFITLTIDLIIIISAI